jgi:hypothetical protein
MFKIRWSHLRVVLVVGFCAAVVVPPAAALAQDALSNPSAAQYAPQSQVQGTSGNGPSSGPTAGNTTAAPAAPTATEGASGSLPFTGMDLAVVAAVALLMIVSGLALRRLSTPRVM